MFTKITIQTRNKVDILDITSQVQQTISDLEIEDGICFVYCPHTTAGIVLSENWDPAVERDIALALEHMIPEHLSFTHREQNSPAHIKSVLLGSDHFIFIHQGRLEVGQWQGIFFAEFDGPRHRTIWIKAVSDAPSG
ncbi:MAG: secondary thiamine-phosphate synthase enzyme YjbQ [Anaerolineae bacterium]|nr:secondary thiamine-phosphate synthase enzyme YjbQ [Anaerolineae bacterium]